MRGGSRGLPARRRGAYNFKSYKVPGGSVTPDPDSEHYIGRERMLIVCDPTLAIVTGNNAFKRMQLVVDRVAYRLLNYAGRARRVKPFRAPLALITDAQTGRPRPLRYGDPISIGGQAGWFIRSAPLTINTDHHQSGQYEAERLIPL